LPTAIRAALTRYIDIFAIAYLDDMDNQFPAPDLVDESIIALSHQEGLIRTLYFSTALEFRYDILEHQVRFARFCWGFMGTP
jgi:hypothetical protein